MTLLIDLGEVPVEHCNDCLADLFKALAEEPTRDGIWAPVDDPLTAGLTEAVTARFQAIVAAIKAVFDRLLAGDSDVLMKADVPWERWSPADFEAVRRRLASLPAHTYTLQDWLLLVDWVLQRYLGPDTIRTEAEHIAVRASIMARVQAGLPVTDANIPPELRDAWRVLPTDFAQVPSKLFSATETAAMRYAEASAAVHISNVTEAARGRMKQLVMEHAQAQILGQKEGGYGYLQRRLFDEFGNLNRDFRRVAVTEVGETLCQGFIAAQKPGARVKRLEAYRGACDFCRSINGRTFRVVAPADAAGADGQADVWVGKTNVGRSAAPRERVGNLLVERPVSERWWPAAGLQHPHCRGRWQAVADVKPGASPEFEKWLRARLRDRLPELRKLEPEPA